MSEMIASNDCLSTLPIASSVDVAITKLTPNASREWRSLMLLSGLSSTHRTIERPARRITRGVTTSATSSTASRVFWTALSGVVPSSGRETAAAASAAAASACLRLPDASKPAPFKENSPMFAMNSRRADPKRMRTNRSKAGQTIVPSNLVRASRTLMR